MLMITVETEEPIVTLRLDGRLAGPEARELARSWPAAAFNQPRQRVLFDLAGVTSVDVLGKEFLAQVHRQGDALVAGVTTRAIVEEIVRDPTECHPGDEPRAVHDDASAHGRS